ncbi:endonuclease NucS domain-containing protein [Nostoc sp. NMS4]|uniref:endonuclease NucS domain-containing protein n=1 Tax=Nostoc sp. NMS4 TaxID=2815390 RepID=UPI0025CC299E|nr:endonuclease NucS domain-containing protein [Nostoc sp. NMS4]MBN3927127.1 DUF91 domain-containing protein [Nostoc sp. NMS4]
MLEQLSFLIKRYNLQWILFEGEMKFVVGHLAKAKGKDSKDFAKNFIVNGKCGLPGKFELLTGERLKIFKYNFNYRYEETIPKARQLWVADHLGAYSYLVLNTCLQPTGMVFREVDIESEYQFNFGGQRQLKLDSGRADIITIDEVVELKRHTIDCNSVGQLLRYLKDTDRFRGKLVAPHIHADALNLISLLNEQGYEIKYINVILNNEYKKLH